MPCIFAFRSRCPIDKRVGERHGWRRQSPRQQLKDSRRSDLEICLLFSIGDALLKVILPVRYYQVLKEIAFMNGIIVSLSITRDSGDRLVSIQTVRVGGSWLSIFSLAEGVVFGYSPGGVSNEPNLVSERPGRQLYLQIFPTEEAAIERTQQTVPS